MIRWLKSGWHFLLTPKHVLRQYLDRRPNSQYVSELKLMRNLYDQSSSYVSDLNENGIVRLERFLCDSELQEVRVEFDKCVVDSSVHNTAAKFSDAVSLSETLLRCGLDERALMIIGRYIRRPFALARARGMTLLKTAPIREGSFQWHHDCRGRQVHLMILLSDLPSGSQTMKYLMKTHYRFYSYWESSSVGSRFENKIRELNADEVMELSGRAGDAFLFDSNGLHSGTRNDVTERDTLLFCYTATKRFCQPLKCSKDVFCSLPKHARKIVENNPSLMLVE